jgi:hypothetical protein
VVDSTAFSNFVTSLAASVWGGGACVVEGGVSIRKAKSKRLKLVRRVWHTLDRHWKGCV